MISSMKHRTFRHHHATVRVILAEEQQRQLFMEDTEQKMHLLSKDLLTAKNKVNEPLAKMLIF